MRELIIEDNIFRIIVVLEDGKISMVRVRSLDKEIYRGDIFASRIKNISKDGRSIFLEIGSKKNAYLQLKTKNDSYHEGDMIAVEVLKEEVGNKNPKVTDDWSISEGSLVIRPGKGISFSSSLKEDSKTLDSLKKYLPRDTRFNTLYRSQTSFEDLKDILDNYDKASKKYLEIQNNISSILKPELLHRRNYEIRYIMEYYNYDFLNIITNSNTAFEEINNILNNNNSKQSVNLVEESPLDLLGIRSSIEKLREKKVILKSGGNIVIEETESMTTIDVNTSKGTIRGIKEVRNTNLEALEEIAKQIEGRNIGGMILVDFIDMKEDKLKEELYLKSVDLFKKTTVRTKSYPLTELDIMQIVRRKEGSSLSETLFAANLDRKQKYSLKYITELLYRDIKKISLENENMDINIILYIDSFYKTNKMDEILSKLSDDFNNIKMQIEYNPTTDGYKILKTITVK